MHHCSFLFVVYLSASIYYKLLFWNTDEPIVRRKNENIRKKKKKQKYVEEFSPSSLCVSLCVVVCACVSVVHLCLKIISWSQAAPQIFVFRIQLPSSYIHISTLYLSLSILCLQSTIYISIYAFAPHISYFLLCEPYSLFPIEIIFICLFVNCAWQRRKQPNENAKEERKKKQKENWNMSNEQAHAISVCGGVVGHELEHTVYS